MSSYKIRGGRPSKPRGGRKYLQARKKRRKTPLKKVERFEECKTPPAWTTGTSPNWEREGGGETSGGGRILVRGDEELCATIDGIRENRKGSLWKTSPPEKTALFVWATNAEHRVQEGTNWVLRKQGGSPENEGTGTWCLPLEAHGGGGERLDPRLGAVHTREQPLNVEDTWRGGGSPEDSLEHTPGRGLFRRF